MFKRPLIWILGIWIIGEIGASYLGIWEIPPTTLDTVMETRGEDSLPVFAVGRLRSVSADEYGARAVLDCEGLVPAEAELSGRELETHSLLLRAADGAAEAALLSLSPGAEISVAGELAAFDRAMNPGEFDLRAYYRIRGIDYRLKTEQVRLLKEPDTLLGKAAARLRARLAEVLEQVAADEAEAGIFRKLLLGDGAALPDEIYEDFRIGGIAHILSVSGLHLTILGAGLWKLLRRLGLPLLPAGAAAGAVMTGYVAFIGGGPSAIRALIMFLVMVGGAVLGRTYDLLSALGLAGLLMLAEQPLYAFDAGFQLSFSAMAGIGILYPAARKRLEEQEKRWKKQRRSLLLQAAKAAPPVLFSLSVQLAVLPVTAWHYYEVPLYGFFLNLIAAPLTGAALLSVFAAAAGGLIWIPAGIFFGGTAHYIFRALLWLCRRAAALPGALLVIGRPAPWQLLLYYGLLAFLLWGGRGRLIWGLAAALTLQPLPAAGLSVTALYVGQGDCLVMTLPGGGALISDCGSGDRTDAGETVLLPFLKYNGISRVKTVFLSHPDADHTNALAALLADPAVQVEGIVVSAAAGALWEPVRTLAEAGGVPVYALETGDRYGSEAYSLEVLWPAATETAAEVNRLSLVLRLESGDFSMLFTGDTDMAAEQRYAAGAAPVQVLKVAHHGSRGSTSEALLAAVQPTAAIISCGKNNMYGHPHAETLERLRAAGTEIFITAEQGAVTASAEGVSTFLAP